MYALDAGHFNVCGGAGPGNVGGEHWRLCTAREIFGQCLNHLAGAEDAEVPVGKKRNHAPAFALGVVKHDGSRVGDSREGSGHDPLTKFDFGGLHAVIDLPVETRCEPGCGKSRRGDKPASAAGCEALRNSGLELIRRTLRHVGVVLAKPVDHQAYPGRAVESAVPHVISSQVRVRRLGGALCGVTNPVQNQQARWSGLAHRPSFVRTREPFSCSGWCR